MTDAMVPQHPLYSRLLVPVVALFTAVALMLSTAVRADDEEDLRRYVDRNTQALVDKLNAERGLYEEDREAFYQSMNEELTEFVDFRRIAARVMGRYARQAEPEQRDEFVEKFKRSLFDSYARALVDSEEFTIEVKEASIREGGDRASVGMELETADGSRYPVTYSMFRKDGKWMMENVIVEGINIGLAFRDRFSQEMESRRGDVQAVIDNWDSAVESLELDDEVERS